MLRTVSRMFSTVLITSHCLPSFSVIGIVSWINHFLGLSWLMESRCLTAAPSSSLDQNTWWSLSSMQTLMSETHMPNTFKSPIWQTEPVTMTLYSALKFPGSLEGTTHSQRHDHAFAWAPLPLSPSASALDRSQPPDVGEEKQPHIITDLKMALDNLEDCAFTEAYIAMGLH